MKSASSFRTEADEHVIIPVIFSVKQDMYVCSLWSYLIDYNRRALILNHGKRQMTNHAISVSKAGFGALFTLYSQKYFLVFGLDVTGMFILYIRSLDGTDEWFFHYLHAVLALPYENNLD